MRARRQRGGLGGPEQPLPMVLVTLLLAMGCFIPQVTATPYFKKSNELKILDFLLHKSNYDKRIRPDMEDADLPLRVNVGIGLLTLSSPDESSVKYEVEFLLHQSWVDPRLKHNDSFRFSYLSGMHHLDSIWLPDLYFIKHGDFKEPEQPDHIALQIFRNGTVCYARRRHLSLLCLGDLALFPFDDPACSFLVESISYEVEDLYLYWMNNTESSNGKYLHKGPNLNVLNAYLITNSTKRCNETERSVWRGDYSCLKVDLLFSRDDDFYYSTVFIPSIILVTSSFITFWLEWNAVPARVMIGVTTMLNFFTTSNSFRASLPVVANLGAMNLWDSVCMFFIYVSLLEFVIVNYVGRKRPKHNMAYMPGENAVIQRIPAAIHRIGLSLRRCLTEKKHQQQRGDDSSDGDATTEGPENLNLTNRNSHEPVSCNNCGNSQCSHSNTANNCTNGGEEPPEISQVEYTFNKPRSKDPPHPIRVAKSIDVIARVVFPLGYSIFLLYFFAKYSIKKIP